jgi:hypothetical protein
MCSIFFIRTPCVKSDVKESFIHLYKKKHLVAIVLATAIAFPTTVALAPISIIADIFAGTIQASLRLCQGADKDEILLILHKKVIASPVQQGIYLLTSVIALGILAGGMIIRMHQEGIRFIPAFAVSALVVSAIMGNVVYWNSQFVVASLPRFFIPDGYNVFIKGGAKDEFGIKVDFDPERKYLKWRHEWRHEFEETDKAYFDNIFANAIKETENELNKLSINFPQNFKTFRAWFSSDKKTYKLFGFSSADKVDENGLNKQFRALALQCHPDKFPDKEKKKEAEIWFKLLMAARFDVEENILKKRSAH